MALLIKKEKLLKSQKINEKVSKMIKNKKLKHKDH
jgi:hypothetical protein